MSSFNRVVLLGNLTRDWELRYTPKGVAVASTSIALNRRWKDEAGVEKEEVTFVELTAFAGAAETLAQYTEKGSLLMLEGRLRQEKWEDKKTGDNRQKLSVVVQGFQFVGGQKGESEDRPLRKAEKKEAKEAAEELSEEDDVPF